MLFYAFHELLHLLPIVIVNWFGATFLNDDLLSCLAEFFELAVYEDFLVYLILALFSVGLAPVLLLFPLPLGHPLFKVLNSNSFVN